MKEGRFTIPTFLYLSADQRTRLQRLLHQREIELPELLTELLAAHLEMLPTPPDEPPPPTFDVGAELERRRAELRRLQSRVRASGGLSPAWLAQMIDDLHAEVARLERMVGGTI